MVGNLARKLDNASKAEFKISEAPVKWCSVSLSEVVERGKRLEASVFDVEARQAWDLINNNKYLRKIQTYLGKEIRIPDLSAFFCC